MRAVSLYLTVTRASFLRTYDHFLVHHKLTTSLWYYYHIYHSLPEKTIKMLLIKNKDFLLLHMKSLSTSDIPQDFSW